MARILVLSLLAVGACAVGLTAVVRARIAGGAKGGGCGDSADVRVHRRQRTRRVHAGGAVPQLRGGDREHDRRGRGGGARLGRLRRVHGQQVDHDRRCARRACRDHDFRRYRDQRPSGGAFDTVVLRNLYVTGLGGQDGIFHQTGTLHVESCVVTGFTGVGLMSNAWNNTLVVTGSRFRHNGNIGLYVTGGAGFPIKVEVADTRADKNGTGFVFFNAKGSIVRSAAARNDDEGFRIHLASDVRARRLDRRRQRRRRGQRGERRYQRCPLGHGAQQQRRHRARRDLQPEASRRSAAPPSRATGSAWRQRAAGSSRASATTLSAATVSTHSARYSRSSRPELRRRGAGASCSGVLAAAATTRSACQAGGAGTCATPAAAPRAPGSVGSRLLARERTSPVQR